MTTFVIIPSIRVLKYWHKFEENMTYHGFNLKNIEVMVIDEDDKNRKENEEILKNVRHSFYGESERKKWFNDHDMRNLFNVIPKKCHAETSFGLLYAWKNRHSYENIIFIDDDIAPEKNDDFFRNHLNQLGLRNIDVLSGDNRWINLFTTYYHMYNTKYPRGFPYELRDLVDTHDRRKILIDVVLNQGLWVNQLDLNAVDILPNLNGLTHPLKGNSSIFNSQNIYIDKDTYTTICSMNLSFKPEIIPAFYQLPMKIDNIDRFDDIWTGVIFKKIADHLNKFTSHGIPLCEHHKEPRNTFDDIITEAHGLKINEELWKVIDGMHLNGNSWKDCYYEIALQLMDRDGYYKTMSNYMMMWLSCIDILE